MAYHPYITETPLRLKLRDQLARLNRVVAESDQSWRIPQAKRLATRIGHWIATETDITLSLKPIEHIGYRVDDVCRHVERVSNFDGEPLNQTEAAKLRALGAGTLGCRFDRKAA